MKIKWDNLSNLEREVYKRMHPNWKDLLNTEYNYIRDINKIKELFKYKRVGLEIEDDGSINTHKRIRINQIDNILDKNGHLVVKFNKCYDTFFSWDNAVTSLEGFPEIVYDTLGIINASIKDLKGCPKIIKGYCFIENCLMLESLEGLPEQIDGDLVLELNKDLLKIINEKYIRDRCNVTGSIDIRSIYSGVEK